MDIGLPADSSCVNRALEILSATYACDAVAGKVLKMFYVDLFRELQKHEVQYLVIGGIAINLHGVERATMDVDLVLAMDESNLRRFLAAAQKLQLRPNLPVELEALCNATQLDEWIREKNMIAFCLRPPSKTAPSIDIIVRPKVSFEAMYRNRIEKDIGGVQFKVASIDDLIALKTDTGRKQDASDIVALNMVKRILAKGK
jgi:hypothetical protein